MSSYKISNTSLNPKRVFILQKSEFEKRFDPQFYINKVVIKNPIKLSKIVEIKGGKRIPKGQYYSAELTDYKYLRVSNIKDYGLIDWDNLNYISQDIYEYLERYKVEKGDVIISIAGTVGKTALIEKDISNIILTENCAKLIIKSKDTLLPKYLHILLELSTTKRQIELGFIQTTIPKLGFDKIEQIQIPQIPSIDKQQEIIKLYEQSIYLKQQNEAEAEKLLSSIDNYLLKELGITLPIQEENTLKSRMFTTSFKEVSNTRFDPYYHTEYFKQIDKNLHQSKYTLLKLRSICNLQNGYAFKSNDYSLDETNTLNIRMSNIRPNNNFDADYNIRYLPDNYSEIFKEYLLNDGDILIAMTDMAADPKILGVPTIVKNSYNRNLLLNQRVGKLFDFDFSKIEINYLKEILGSAIVKAYYNKMGARGVQINISSEQILSAFIPVPPLEKQIEIADHISKIRQQAQELKDKTKLALQQANQEIENLLLN